MVPLGVVVLEEVAFRGVLWGLVDVGPRCPLGPARSPRCSSGSGTCLPAVDGARANAVEPGSDGDADNAPVARFIPARQVLGTVAFTTVAGVVFAVLREQSGSLLAPFLLHWATNGLGILAAAWAWTAHAD